MADDAATDPTVTGADLASHTAVDSDDADSDDADSGDGLTALFDDSDDPFESDEPAGPPTWLADPSDTPSSTAPFTSVAPPTGTGDAWDLPKAPAARPEVPVQLGEVVDDDRQRATRRAVARALAEDLGDAGDVTTAATVSALREGTADLVARADGIVAGLGVLREVFAQVDPRVVIELRVADGDAVAAGDVVASVRGRLRSILTAERTALNFLCHLSGIATQTRRFVDAIAHTDAVVRDTRKTTPGLRLLEKAAVAAGGGSNHRVGLYDALLVKDNHVLAAGSPAQAARTAMERSGGRHVQVEVSSLDEIDAVLRAGVDDILLDNLTPDEVRLAVRRVAGRARLEASGNVTLDTIGDYAETGVDRIACGALTHSAPWLDLALDVRPQDPDGGRPGPEDPARDEAPVAAPHPWSSNEGADVATGGPQGRFAVDADDLGERS